MRKPGRRVLLEVRKAIERNAQEYRLRGETPNAAAIRRHLEKNPDYRKDLPTERTVRAIASEEGHDNSGAWRATTSAIDTQLVLPVLAALIEATDGRRTQLSVREAEVIAEIRESVAIPPFFAWTLASSYVDAESTSDISRLIDLDAFLAYAPWTSTEAQQRYMKVIEEGWVRQAMNWPDPPDATPLSERKSSP